MSPAHTCQRLHLIACTPEDAAVISALAQDARIRAGDICYDARRRRLVLVGERTCRERQVAAQVPFGLSICGVAKVQRKAWPRTADQGLQLLAICAAGDESTVKLVFAGGPELRLETECVDMLLDDIGDPEPTGEVPRHPVSEGGPRR
jgi:hypothetical protein